MKHIIAEQKGIGTNNAIFNRIFLQFSQMIKCGAFWIEEEKQQEFSNLLYYLMNEMLKTELTVKEYFKIENDYIKRIETKEAIIENNTSIIYEDPSFELHKIFEDFLIRSIISIRKFLRVASYIIEVEYKDHRKFVNYIQSKLSVDSHNHKVLGDVAQIIKNIFDFRNLIEHEQLEVERFKIFQNNDNLGVSLPKIKGKDEYLRDYMYGTIHQLFNYFEDMIALLLKSIYRGLGEIIALPEDKWEENKGFKYKIDLSKL